MHRLLKILKLALAAWQSHPSPAICVLFDFAHFVNFNIHQKGFRMKLILIYMQLKTAHAPQKKSNGFKYELRRPEGAVVAPFKSLLVRFHAAQLQYSPLQRDMCFCPEWPFACAKLLALQSQSGSFELKPSGLNVTRVWVKSLHAVIYTEADLSKIKAHVLPGICTQIWRCGKIFILGQ